MNISQDGFFLPLPPPPPPPPTTINGFVQAHQEHYPNYQNPNPNPNPDITSAGTSNKRKRNSCRTPDAETEVVALSPRSLMATHRFFCEVCNKGFQRDQNLQLHRRGHNLPWKLKQRASNEQVKKKVYICPEMSCVNHDPSRALGDLTGIKKHYSRKHGEKNLKCDKCSKKYAVMSDWKAHIKICGTRQYKCTCDTIFSRKDSFMSHKAVCDTLTDERMRMSTTITESSLTWNIMRSDLIHGSLISAPPSVAPVIFSLPASQRQDLLGNFEPSSSNETNSMNVAGLINKPWPPLWLDHHHIRSGSEAFFVPWSSVSGASPSFPELRAADSSLFATSRPLVPQRPALLKDEEEINKPIFHPESLITLYSSTPSSSSSSLSNMNLHQRHLLRQHMNNQLAGEQGFATRNELSVMCNALSGDEFDDGSRERQGKSVGMRDFLGSLGGGEQGERRVFVQEGIAYELSTMAGSHQEPYMDLMR